MKIRSRIAWIIFAFVVFALAVPATAMDPIPKRTGFSGFVRPGVGYLDMETNMVAEFLGWELSSDPISSLTSSPDGESNGVILLPFQINYTFSRDTQVFLGTELSNLARFDMAQQLGVKQNIVDFGLLQVSLLFSGLGAEVWQDPYIAGATRTKTDRDSHGARLGLGKILGSGLDIIYTYRNIDIDTENSGVNEVSLGNLTNAQRGLLDRNGNQHYLEVIYDFDLGGGPPHHSWPPLPERRSRRERSKQ